MNEVIMKTPVQKYFLCRRNKDDCENNFKRYSKSLRFVPDFVVGFI